VHASFIELHGTVKDVVLLTEDVLKRIQYRPELIEGFRVQTGLALDPQLP
jgi:hypothetical protein